MSGQKLICHRVIRHQRHILIEFIVADGLHDLRRQGFELQLQEHAKLRLLQDRLRRLLRVVRIDSLINESVEIRPGKSRAVAFDPQVSPCISARPDHVSRPAFALRGEILIVHDLSKAENSI